MELEIIKVKESDQEYIRIMTDWIYNWWGEAEGYPWEEIESFCRHSASENRIPQTFLALADGKPAGMYQILMSDCKSRTDIYPWLTDVYVDETFRGQGIGKRLVESVPEKAQQLHQTELYLYTHLHGFYEKFGWEFVERFDPYTTPKGIQNLYRLKIVPTAWR
ncbi:MAG: GNAT family N-acetyltransferase [Fusicatenibacter sp.]